MANKVNINKEASKASIEKLRSAANLSIDAIDYAVHVADAYTDLKSFSNFFEGHAKIKDALVYLSSMVEGDANALDLCVDNMFTLDKDMGAGWIYDSKTEYKSGKDYDIDKTKSEDLKTESRAEYKATKAAIAVSEFAIGWVAGDAVFDVAGMALKPVFKVAMKTPAGKTAAKVLGNAATKVKGKVFGLSEKALSKLAGKTKSPILKKLSEAFGGKATFVEAGALIKSKITTKVGSTKLGAKILGGESKIGAKSAVTEVRNKIFGKTETKAASTGGKILKGTGSKADELGKGIKTIDKAEDASKGIKTIDKAEDARKGVRTLDKADDAERSVRAIDKADDVEKGARTLDKAEDAEKGAKTLDNDVKASQTKAHEQKTTSHPNNETKAASHTNSEARATEQAGNEARTASHTTSEARAAEHAGSETRTASHTANETRTAEHAGSEARTAEHAGSDVRNAETAGQEAAERGRDAGQYDSYRGHEQTFKEEQAYKDSVNELRGETEAPRHETFDDFEARKKSVDELRDETEAPRHKTYEQYKEEMAAKAEHPQASEPTRVVENETSTTQIHDEEYMRRREALDRELDGDGPAQHTDYETWKANHDSVEGLKGETEVPRHQPQSPVDDALDDMKNWDNLSDAEKKDFQDKFNALSPEQKARLYEEADRVEKAQNAAQHTTSHIDDISSVEQPKVSERPVTKAEPDNVTDFNYNRSPVNGVDDVPNYDYAPRAQGSGGRMIFDDSVLVDGKVPQELIDREMRARGLPKDGTIEIYSRKEFEEKLARNMMDTPDIPATAERPVVQTDFKKIDDLENYYKGLSDVEYRHDGAYKVDYEVKLNPDGSHYVEKISTKLDAPPSEDAMRLKLPDDPDDFNSVPDFEYKNKPFTPTENTPLSPEPVHFVDNPYQPNEIENAGILKIQPDDITSHVDDIPRAEQPRVSERPVTKFDGDNATNFNYNNDVDDALNFKYENKPSSPIEDVSSPHEPVQVTERSYKISDDEVPKFEYDHVRDVNKVETQPVEIKDSPKIINKTDNVAPADNASSVVSEVNDVAHPEINSHKATIDEGFSTKESSLPDDIFGETPHRTTIDDGISQKESSLPNDIFGETPHRTTIDDGISQNESSLPNDIFGEAPHKTTIADNTDDALDINRTISHADETSSVVNNADDIPPSEVHQEIEKPSSSVTDDFADEITTSKPVVEEMPSANNPVKEPPHSQVTDDFLDDASLTSHNSVTPDRPSSAVSSPTEEFADTLEDVVPGDVHDGNLKTDDELERAVPDKIHNEEYGADDLFPDDPSNADDFDSVYHKKDAVDKTVDTAVDKVTDGNSVQSSASVDVDNHSASPLQTHVTEKVNTVQDVSNATDDVLFPDEDIAPTKSHTNVDKPMDVKNPSEGEQALPSDIFGETSHYDNDYVPLKDMTEGKSVPETIVNENGTTLKYNGHTQKYEGMYQGEKIEVSAKDVIKNKDDYLPETFVDDKGIKHIHQNGSYKAVDVQTGKVVDEYPISKASDKYNALPKTDRAAPDTFTHEASGDSFIRDKSNNDFIRYHNGKAVDKVSSYDAERLYNAQYSNQAPSHFYEPDRNITYNLANNGKSYEVTYGDGRSIEVPVSQIDDYYNTNRFTCETNLDDPSAYIDHDYINAEKERKKAEMEEYLANGGLPLIF